MTCGERGGEIDRGARQKAKSKNKWLTLVVPLDVGVGGDDRAEQARLDIVSLEVGLVGRSHGDWFLCDDV